MSHLRRLVGGRSMGDVAAQVPLPREGPLSLQITLPVSSLTR